MTEIKRISPQEASEKTLSGQALLVCAYDDEQKCGRMLLQGAQTLREFKSKLSSLSKENSIIFYCA